MAALTKPERRSLMPTITRSAHAIAAAGAVVAVLAVGAFAAFEFSNRAAEFRESQRLIAGVSATLAEEAGRILDVANLVAERAMDASQGRSWDEIERDQALYERFVRLSKSYDFISAVWLVDEKGMPRLTNRAFPAPPIGVADREHFQVHRDSNPGPYLSPLIRSRTVSESNIVFTRRLEDDQGRFRGVALVVLDPTHFLRLYREIQFDLPLSIELLRFDRKVLIRAPAESADSALDARKMTGPTIDRDSAMAGMFSAREPGDRDTKTQAYRQVRGFPLYIVVSVSDDDVEARWFQQMSLHGIYAGLALAALLAALAAAHRFSRREAEVMAALQALNASLEGRVRDRTDTLERLLKEVTHRVKNSLQLTSSMLRLQQRHAADPTVATQLAEAQARVLTIARLHEHLYQAGNFEQVELRRYLGTICTDLAAALPGHGCAFACTLHRSLVRVDLAVPLALIVTELVTNAMKHAFVGPLGTVAVTLEDAGDGRGRLVVADDGVGLPPDFSPERAAGLGMQIIRGLVGQVHGTLRAQGGSGGTRFEVVFPLDQ